VEEAGRSQGLVEVQEAGQLVGSRELHALINRYSFVHTTYIKSYSPRGRALYTCRRYRAQEEPSNPAERSESSL